MKRSISVLAVVVFVSATLVRGVSAEPKAEGVPTFTKDVAPILFDNCVICHRPNEMAPMSLMTYGAVRPWARAIKEKVLSREMPPWHADPDETSVAFINDRSLTQAEIDIIVAWVDGGAPKGDDADLPSLPQFSEGWLIRDLGDPDVVIYMPAEVEIAAEGESSGGTNYYTAVPWKDVRYAKALESKPSNRRATHHTVVNLVKNLPAGTVLDERGIPVGNPAAARADFSDSVESAQRNIKLTGYAPGKGYKRYSDGAARMLPPDWYFVFNQHYQPTGQPERDRSMMGVWFHKAGTPVSMDVRETGAAGTNIVNGQEIMGTRVPVIPPHADNYKYVKVQPFAEDVTIFSLAPHMHLRGKDARYVLVLPDGTERTLLWVPRYDFNWQTFYELEEPLMIPAGSKLIATAHFDNSANNRYNPSPEKEVYWAEQSWDEMWAPFYEMGVELETPVIVRGTTEE